MTSENQTECTQLFVKTLKDFGGIDHHPPIEKADLVQMYQYFDFTNPKHLQWKVFCDIMLYFDRRGQ
jgi:hypothetical protein